jgi:hypothetical protein
MRLILHIFLKDLRRQRLEILGYCVSVVVWAWREIHPAAFEWLRERELLPMLMFGLWFLITIRAVQGESLVGDKEWWPTRPFRWGQLLAAKTLLLATVLNGPLLVAQLYLLIHAEIPLTWALVPGLLILQGMFFLLLTFPAAVLASITASVVQWAMSIVGIFLAVTVTAWLPWGKLPKTLAGQEDVSSWATALLLLSCMTAALVWQYARRREWPARILLAIGLLSIPLGILFASTAQARWMAYPYAGSVSSMKLAIKPAENGVREFDWTSGDEIKIPVVDPALGSDEAIQIEGYRLHLAGSGWQWESNWKNSGHNLIFFNPDFILEEGLPDWVYKQVTQGHATARVDLAWESYRFNPPVRAQAATYGLGFTVPGIGHCGMRPTAQITAFARLNWPDCVAPLTLPPVYLIAIDPDGNRCRSWDGDSEVPAGHTAYKLEFGSSAPAYFDPNPVRSFSLQAGDWVPALAQKPGEVGYRSALVCPGGSFTVRTGKPLDRQRATFDLGDIGVGKIHTTDETPKQEILKFNPDNE